MGKFYGMLKEILIKREMTDIDLLVHLQEKVDFSQVLMNDWELVY
jgi:hypothetical protein